jgi:hypothetical protein
MPTSDNTIDVTHISRQDFFASSWSENEADKKVLLVINVIIKIFVWDCEQNFTVPNLRDLKLNCKRELKMYMKISTNLERIYGRSTFGTINNFLQELG